MKSETTLKAAFVTLIIAGAYLVTAQAQPAEKPADMKDAKSAEPAPPAPAEMKTPDVNAAEVIIKFGNEDLTMQQVLWRIANPGPTEIARLAESWLQTELLYAEAQRRGITNQPKAKFFADVMRKSAFAQELQRQVVEAVNVTDQDVKTYYDNNKNIDPELTTPGAMSFSHIRTKTLEEAQAALKKIKAGDDINQLAKSLSVAVDAVLGGTVNQQSYSQVGRLYGPDFLDRIKAAEDGQLIGPVSILVRGQTFFEVARKSSEVKPVPLPFEQVKEELKPRLLRAAQRTAYDSLLESLKKDAADKVIKSKTLIDAEKAPPESPQPRAVRPTRPRTSVTPTRAQRPMPRKK